LTSLVVQLEQAAKDLRSLAADPADAAERKRYLKSPYTVLGCKVPEIRKVARRTAKACPASTADDVAGACLLLYQSDVHEERLLGALLAESYRHLLDAQHVKGFLKDMLLDSHNWDFVDAISTGVIGWIVLDHPDAWREIDRWKTDDWMWLRRASLVSHLVAVRKDQIQTDQLRAAIDQLVEEKEFFIRKAIGWVLRDMSRYRPDLCIHLVEEFAQRMSTLTFREATKRLPAADRERLCK